MGHGRGGGGRGPTSVEITSDASQDQRCDGELFSRMRMDLSKTRRLFREVLLVGISPDYCLRIFFLCLCSQKMFSQDRPFSILSLLEGAPLPFWLLLLLLSW